MAFDLLTTSGINSLVNYYANNESQKRIAPLQTRKTKYTSISNIYSGLLTKVDALKSKMNILKATGTSSAFAVKKATSSNTTAVTVSAGTAAQKGAFALRVNQLAKNDLVVSLVKHKTYIDVNEVGTEAAAITIVEMRITAVGPGDTFYMNVNKPFFYVIRDSVSNEILFMGQVVEPKY
jgi:flagellar capping protein FliD